MDFGPADGSSGSERIAPSNWNLATDGNDAAAQKSFAQRYRLSTGMLPSPAATETYDAVLLTVRALRAAGPNRARVRDQLASVRNFAGASGTISFDREGNNTTALHMVWQKEVWLKEREVLE
jgi:ABC-type branched-subunit amino acid transport system substrate-binding protein